MVLGMSLETFTLVHVLNQSGWNCIRNRRDVRVPQQPKARSLDGYFSRHDRVDKHNGVPFSVYSGDAGNQAGNHLDGRARYCRCGTLFAAPQLEEGLRHWGMCSLVLQCFRFCSAIL